MVEFMRVLKCELLARDIYSKSDIRSKTRVMHINRPRFEKCTDNEAYFSVTSQFNPPKEHIVIIQAPSITEDTTVNDLKKIVRKEDIKIACSCEAFLYWGYKYISYKAQAGIDPETRAPNVRNPKQVGMACKHILAVLRMLGI